MMLDEDIVAVSPAPTYRILSNAGLLNRWRKVSSGKKIMDLTSHVKFTIRRGGLAH